MGSSRYPEIPAPADGGDIAAGTVPLAALADLAETRTIGRAAGAGTGVPQALTQTQLTALIEAASASLPGSLAVADFNKLATLPTGSRIPGTIISPTVDLVTLNDTVTLFLSANVPSGYCFMTIQARFFTDSTFAGTISTGPVLSFGTDGGISNVHTMNIGTSATVSTSRATTLVAPQGAPSMSAADYKVKVSTAATGTGLTWKGVVVLDGVWFLPT